MEMVKEEVVEVMVEKLLEMMVEEDVLEVVEGGKHERTALPPPPAPPPPRLFARIQRNKRANIFVFCARGLSGRKQCKSEISGRQPFCATSQSSAIFEMGFRLQTTDINWR